MSNKKYIAGIIGVSFILSYLLPALFYQKYIVPIGHAGITAEQRHTIVTRNKREDYDKDYQNFYLATMLSVYPEMLGIESPDSATEEELKEKLRIKGQSTVSEREIKARANFMRPQIFMPLTLAPVPNGYDHKKAEIAAKAVSGWYLSFSGHTLPSEFKSLKAYAQALRKVNGLHTDEEREAFFKKFGFKFVKDVCYAELRQCVHGLRNNKCGKCARLIDKKYAAFNSNNDFGLKPLEGIALTSAPKGKLMIVHDRNDTRKLVAVFVTSESLNQSVYDRAKSEEAKIFHEQLKSLYKNWIQYYVLQRTPQNSPNLFTMLVILAFIVYV